MTGPSRPSRRALAGGTLFLTLLAAALTARVLWVRRAFVDETVQQLTHSLDATRPALEVWHDAYAAQATLIARLAATDPALAAAADASPAGDVARRAVAARFGTALGALDLHHGAIGGWLYAADGRLLAGSSPTQPGDVKAPHGVARPTTTTGVDPGGVHADVVAPIGAPGAVSEGRPLGMVLVRVRVTDTSFAALNPTRPTNLGLRSMLVTRAGDSVLVVATASFATGAAPRRAFALAEVPPFVREALAGGAAHGTGRGLYGSDVLYAAAGVPVLGWALVREQRRDALFQLVRPAIIIEESVFATMAVLLALSVLGIVRASRARRDATLAQLRGDFVSAVSHELRTPLAQIRLFAELLRKGALRDAAEADRALGVIEKEAGRLTILVDNILSYTSLRRRQRFVTPLAADVAVEARQVIESFAPLAAERGARVVADLEAGTRARVDTQALRQVLLNFLENAVKYGPKGGTVTVGARADGARVRVWVDDEGAGVPASERAAVWDAFYRSESAQRSGVGGSGLGLAVVRDLVAQYGGAVRVEDAPNGGARFVAELPGLARV